MLKALALIRTYWKPLASALAVLAIIGAVLLYGSHKYDQGVDDERARQLLQSIRAAEARSDVDQDIDRLPDGAAARELRELWARD